MKNREFDNEMDVELDSEKVIDEIKGNDDFDDDFPGDFDVEMKEKGSSNTEKKMDDLIAKGKKGALSVSDLEQAIAEFDYDTDKLYDTLESNGISLPIDISQSEMSEIEHEVEKFASSESMERILEQEGLAIDDPVRMYLKEIGKVPLLDAEEEKETPEWIRPAEIERKVLAKVVDHVPNEPDDEERLLEGLAWLAKRMSQKRRNHEHAEQREHEPKDPVAQNAHRVVEVRFEDVWHAIVVGVHVEQRIDEQIDENGNEYASDPAVVIAPISRVIENAQIESSGKHEEQRITREEQRFEQLIVAMRRYLSDKRGIV